jgi:hypothetical protein
VAIAKFCGRKEIIDGVKRMVPGLQDVKETNKDGYRNEL